MLKKLLKHDLTNIFKFLGIFYSLAILFSILTRIFLSINNSFIFGIIGQICSITTIIMLINILINNLMRLWLRFKNNFYGDESYLTHTLPVTKKTLCLSKMLTAIITLFISICVIGITLMIAYYSKENIETIKNIILPVANIYNSTITKILLAFLFIFFLEFSNILQSGYTGIILGHKMNHHLKIIFSILYGFAAYTIIQILGLLTIFIVALFNQDLMNLFFTNEIMNIDIIKLILYLAMIIYTLTLIVGYIINLNLFKKGVNVD